MSDNKKWFKVWATILVDPSLSSLSLSDVGRWVRLGAYMVSCGERGKLTITPPSPVFLLAMEVESFADAKLALKRLPNVSIQEVNNDNGCFIVIIKNWFKYQVDSTAYERVKRSRYKRRGEEKRSLTSTSTSTPTLRDAPPLGAGRATRETSKLTPGGSDARNEELRGTGILEQVAKRRRAQGLEKL
jgi:hypothetical protein